MSAQINRLKMGFYSYFRDNPVLVKELRTRMRGLRAYWMLLAYMALMAITLLITYHSKTSGRSSIDVFTFGHLGKEMFTAIAWTQTIAMMLIIPGLTAGAIAGEYSKKTIEMVVLTKLDSLRFVLGKAMSALSFCVMLIFVALPLAGISLLYGGISPGEIASTFLKTVFLCYTLCAAGLYFSAIVGKTIGAAMLFLGFEAGSLIYLPSWVSYLDQPGIWYGILIPMADADPDLGTIYIFGKPIPWIVITAFVHFLIGSIFLLAAAAKIRHWKVSRVAVLRVGLIVVAIFASFLTINGLVSIGPVIILGVVVPPSVILYILLLAVVIGTGAYQMRPGQSMFSYVLGFREMMKTHTGSALGYMSVLVLAAYSTSLIALGAKDQFHLWTPEYWKVLLMQGAALLLFAWMTVSIGLFFSAMLRSRIAAAFCTLALLALLFIMLAAAMMSEVANWINMKQLAADVLSTLAKDYAFLIPNAALLTVLFLLGAWMIKNNNEGIIE